MTRDPKDQALPYGWIKQVHESGHPYYIDTRANPSRSIWVHPYEDDQFLKEHPDIREKTHPAPDYFPENSGHSFSSTSAPHHKRGFFGKLKDKAIGSKEERQAGKDRIAMLQELRSQQYGANQTFYGGHGTSEYRAPQYGASRYPQTVYQQQPVVASQRRQGGGMGGMALPLVGGLAGGLLLGDLLDGGFNDNNNFGGGDSNGGGDFGGGGGDFGGGDFGGGGF
ncbi:hypothetical protein EV421DRAFT_1895867 [Armillaria borealis]|uniref:WW domain-containing protein n=1 Tax=Armillaria borealis TaxID=47425 RepID=A0AA39KDB1_9AGAR|nr:hypothetical protein EV421DRAFT_1895867 [Armillaria borealis]